MSHKTSSSSSSGVGFFGLLAVLFIGLKLTNHIDWSWWWVLAPLWGPAAAVVAIGLGILLYQIIWRPRRKPSGPYLRPTRFSDDL